MRFMVLILSLWARSILCNVLDEENTTLLTYTNYPTSERPCTCDRRDDFSKDILHCYCRGKTLRDIPNNLDRSLRKLTVYKSDIECITKSSLLPYRENLRDITLSNLPYLRVIQDGSFANMSNLRTLYISYAPQLKFLNGLLKGVTSKTFYSLRIVWTGLTDIPDFTDLSSENTMFLLDLDHNKIETLSANSIKIAAQQVTMNFNLISYVHDYAFNGSQIAELYMHSNHRLYKLGEHAFKGLRSLRLLDLSQTIINTLPVDGLEELEILKIEDAPSLQTIPSIYDLRNLKEARLTHSFHCCAFRYPEQHNPLKHAQYEKNMKKICKELQKVHEISTERKKRHLTDDYPRYYQMNLSDIFQNQQNREETLPPLRGQTISRQEGKDLDSYEDIDDGFFHAPTKVDKLDAYCGNIIFMIPEVDCSPEPNALNPCEDIMGGSWLRISVWCVLILAIVGNLSVIFVVVFSESEINVSRFMICNLAIADFCMGIYLLLIASMDYHSVGEYFNFAYNWQYGIGCQIAGFLTVFSSHLSIYTLTVITLERWFAITYAIHLTKRITIKKAIVILMFGWIYSILMAALPVFGVSNYSSTSICLPMETNKLVDKAYLYAIIFINGSAFAIIVVCYIQIYLSLGYETRQACSKGEMTIAKKMSLLVFVDFATVAPVAFFGLTALAGYPLIGVPRSKILLVFFYPLNACANPYLYALMTAQYRRDLFLLVSKCGICRKKAERYKLSDIYPLTATGGPACRSHGASNGNVPRLSESETKTNSTYV